MKHTFFLLAVLFFISPVARSQKYFTKNGHISFFSKAPLENIKADNNQVINVLNIPTGAVQFSMLIKNFHFAKSLMEVHFNENYMESESYPEASFAGKIIEDIDFSKPGSYSIRAKGFLFIHGVQQERIIKSELEVKENSIIIHSSFTVLLNDHKILIPKVVSEKLANEIKVEVLAVLLPKQ